MITSFSEEYEFLSNFYPCLICQEPIRNEETQSILLLNWPSAEHFYQSLKTNITKEKLEILRCKTAGQAKRLGSKVTLPADWEKIKISKMEFVVKEKFTQNLDLKDLLISTYPEVLVEGNNWHDNFWGVCFCKSCDNIQGKNILGRILTKIRYQFIDEEM